ncbi:MAG: 16S rRNA (cytosine(967)-C(5))-methyltransferase RsmB [Deltaproteobacteria bacterium]|nr:16S rRNA (cytosine(967)-C(5))-methyltransferase RsmB [Deltaproteobacteria bacterium]
MKPRDLALRVLNRTRGCAARQASTGLDAALNRHAEMPERDRAFTVHLVQGVYRWQIRLDWIVNASVRFPFKQIEPPVLNLLRLAIYQIFFMDRVPASAAVNEAVKQAKAIKGGHVAGFVNGILRNICRNKDRIHFPDPDLDPDLYLSVHYAYPLWLVRKWNRELGRYQTTQLLNAGNAIPPLMLRTHALRCHREELIHRLASEGVKAASASYSPDGIKVERMRGPVNGLPSFKDGLFQVQGEAAQICSHLLDPQPGERVLDVCAGLGGKSTHLASLMNDQGTVVAVDKAQGRLRNLCETAARIRIHSVMPLAGDAAVHLPFSPGMVYDKILVDAPCSGLGVIARHPDIKTTRRPDDIKRLALLQGAILDGAVSLLRPGGRLLYATCTLSREENEGVVEACLSRHHRMRREDLGAHVPSWGEALIDDQGYFRPLPHRHSMEGFFAARLIKR